MKKTTLTAMYVVFAAAALIGLYGLVQRIGSGLKVTDLGNIMPWGLWVALYIYFIGLSAGSFLLSSLVYVFGVKRFEPIGKLAVFSAIITLAAALMFIWVDLGHMWRFYRAFVSPNFSSILAIEIWLYVLYTILLVVELWALFNDNLGLARILGAIGIPVAISVHGGTGAIFAVVKARPYWFTGLFPIIFLISALVSGGALLTLIAAFLSKPVWGQDRSAVVRDLALLTGGLLAFDLLLLLSEYLVGLYGNVPDHTLVYTAIMTGPFWWVFWIVQLALGAVVPLFLIFFPGTRRSTTWLGVAGLLIVLGIVGVRLNIVIPPFANPLLPGLDKAYHSSRTVAYYFPTLVEWITSMGLVGIAGLLFTAGLDFLPLAGEEATA